MGNLLRVLVIILLTQSTLLSAQFRLISTEKEVHKYEDTTFVYQELVQYDCIFQIDSVKQTFTYHNDDGKVKFNIISLDIEEQVYTYYLTRYYKNYKIIIDLNNDIVKTITKKNGEIYANLFRIDKIELLENDNQ